MNILIEIYRGFPIYFVPDSERFSCEIDTGTRKEKQSFASAKKFVDDYLKDNQEFVPFSVSFRDGTNKTKVVGIRKDGRFITENPDGTKGQISSYHEDKYIVDDGTNVTKWAHLAILEAEVDKARGKVREHLETIQGQSLQSIKSKYLPKN